MKADVRRLSKALGYDFKDQDLLSLALSHRSMGSKNNERLEFLGDALLGAVIAADLYARFPKAKEGQLSRLRAQLVSKAPLAALAREMGMGEFLHLGPGEMKSGGSRRDSILADSVEAIIGAIYLDAGMDVVRERILAWNAERLSQLDIKDTRKDPKTQLQEYLQARRLDLPTYEVTQIEGDAHDQTFYVDAKVCVVETPFKGVASSRRVAEQIAAEAVLKHLGVDVDAP